MVLASGGSRSRSLGQRWRSYLLWMLPESEEWTRHGKVESGEVLFWRNRGRSVVGRHRATNEKHREGCVIISDIARRSALRMGVDPLASNSGERNGTVVLAKLWDKSRGMWVMLLWWFSFAIHFFSGTMETWVTRPSGNLFTKRIILEPVKQIPSQNLMGKQRGPSWWRVKIVITPLPSCCPCSLSLELLVYFTIEEKLHQKNDCSVFRQVLVMRITNKNTQVSKY
jgi:hypothetical protein